MLRLERANPQRQLVRVILLLARLLANTIELFANSVPVSQQGFTLLGVLGHSI